MFTTSLFSTPKLAWAVFLLGIDFLVKPTFSLFSVMGIAIVLDFATGLLKAMFKKEARTSKGYRKTVVKLSQYLTPVLILYIAGKFIPEHSVLLKQASGYVMMFVIYIECTSIFENLYEIDNKTVVAKFLYKPVLMLLKLGIENNPISKAAEAADNKGKQQPPVNVP